MKTLIAALLLAGLAACGSPPLDEAVTAADSETSIDCDRICLEEMVNEFMAAMVAHNPSRAPIAANGRYTENSVELKWGDGLWQTITGLGMYQLTMVEPNSGQAGTIAVIKENGLEALMALRLQVVNGGITEAEVLIARQGEGQTLRFDLLDEPLPVLLQAIPENQRQSRQELVGIVDTYFDAIEQSDGDIVPFATDGFRIENGIRTCNDAAAVAGREDTPWTRLLGMPCADQLSTRVFSYIQSIEPRRYMVVDSERGLVLGMFRFNHPGNIIDVRLSDGSDFSMLENPWARNPTSAAIAELFKIENGEIQRVMAVIVKVPYKMPMGW